jgi:thioesterase domain-containing protein
LAVPATLFQIHEHDLEDRCQALVGELAMVRVGGDHHTMLQPPHVAAMAAALTGVITRYV